MTDDLLKHLTPSERRSYEHCAGSDMAVYHSLATARAENAKGNAAIRAFVEATGFTYCESESAVWNAETAVGLLYGTVTAVRSENEQLRADSLTDTKWRRRTHDIAVFASDVPSRCRRNRCIARTA